MTKQDGEEARSSNHLLGLAELAAEIPLTNPVRTRVGFEPPTYVCSFVDGRPLSCQVLINGCRDPWGACRPEHRESRDDLWPKIRRTFAYMFGARVPELSLRVDVSPFPL